ncbi:MAG: LemA family protein [Ottowia sp.]|nr:LemA family protein [Ottowia sp.]
MTTVTVQWIVIAVVAGGLVWAVACYNRLVALRNRIVNAFAQIDVQLKRRHDLIPNLVDVARRYLTHEQATLQAVIEARGQAQGAAARARAQPTDAGAVGLLAVAEQVLTEHVGRLLAIAEAYPELKADATLRQLSEQLTSTENHIGFARQAYNDAVLDLNNKVQAFPDLLVAHLTGFSLAQPLKSTATAAERAVPRIDL